MPIHAWMQQMHSIAIKYLTLLMLNKLKLENHQAQILPTLARTKTTTYKWQNPKNESYNMMLKPTQLAHMKEYITPWSHPWESNSIHVATSQGNMFS